MRLLHKAVEFCDALRQAGLHVSLTSTQIFAQSLGEIDLSSPRDIYWTSHACLVKRPEDIALFNQVFLSFWQATNSLHTLPIPATPITLALDDPEQLPEEHNNENEQNNNPTETVTLRYCAQETLGEKNFADYTDEELVASRILMQSIKVIRPTRRSRRRVAGPKGAFDMRRTVQRTLRSVGEPAEIARTKMGVRPRRLVMLLDVSGSMEPYARALIGFVHTCVATRAGVEAFALGTRLTRLTRELSERDPDKALLAATQSVHDWSGGTRLGDNLGRFNDHWGCRGMARGATVVILSDGWDRGEPEQIASQMQRLSKVAYRLVWVNPLKASPGYAPLAQAMAAALPFVDNFVAGHSLDALRELAELVFEPQLVREQVVREQAMTLPLG